MKATDRFSSVAFRGAGLLLALLVGGTASLALAQAPAKVAATVNGEVISVADVEAMGWDDAEAAAQLLAAMTREISVLEFDVGRRLPAPRRALKRFLGI